MTERSTYKDGEFCWVDLATTDIDAAKKFYGDLIGWEWEAAGDPEETGGYGIFTFNGKQVCGGGPVQAAGQPPAWSSYVKVADADESAGKVTEAGGTVLAPPFELPNESGRMAVCQDAEGAFFSVMQQRAHKGAELVNEIGTWTWNNLMSREVEKAEGFYGKVFGWEAAQPEGAPEFIWNWQMEGQHWPEGLAGLAQIGSDMPAEAPPHWQVYFLVPDLDAAIDQTKGAGGRLLFGPQETPIAKLAVFTDPQGGAFALMEPNYPEPR
jgi:uncharacterized protein